MLLATTMAMHVMNAEAQDFAIGDITTVPAGGIVAPGGTYTLHSYSAPVTNTDVLSYEWYFAAAELSPNVTTSNLTVTGSSTTQGDYYIEVTEQSTVVDTVPVLLLVGATNLTPGPIVGVGTNVVMTVTNIALSSAGTYAWGLTAGGVGGATSHSATTGYTNTVSTAALAAGSYSYTCWVTSHSGGDTTPLTFQFTVQDMPTVTPDAATNFIAVGDSTNIIANVTGSSLSYQWYQSGKALAGATLSSLALNNITASDAGAYTVVVYNVAGSVTNGPSVLIPVATPVITKQPASAAVGPGTNYTVSVTATGSDLSYQWYNAGGPISNATNKSYTTSSSSSVTVVYHVTIDAGGLASTLATSGNATITVEPLPAFTVQPIGVTNAQYTNVILTAAATGNNVSFIWTQNGKVVVTNGYSITIANTWVGSGSASNSVLTLTSPTVSEAGTYVVTASNPAGSVKSSNAVVQLVAAPTLKAPSAVTVLQNGSVTLQVTASGTGPISYQWYSTNTAISHATSPAYVVPASSNSAVHSATYTLWATNFGGISSTNIVVTTVAETTKPVITLAGASGPFTNANGSFVIDGTTSDKIGVQTVTYTVNGGGQQTATAGANGWGSFTINGTGLALGTNNTLIVTAVNSNTLSSSLTAHPVSAPFYSVAVTTDENGTVSSNWTAAGVQWGKTYTATAVPKPNFVIDQWQYNLIGNNTWSTTNAKSFTFTPSGNVQLNVTFETNVFSGSGGTYSGVFSTNAGGNTLTSLDGAGYLSITLNTNQTYSGTLHVGGVSMRMSGLFNDSGVLQTNLTNGTVTASVALTNNPADYNIIGKVVCSTYTVTNVVAVLSPFSKSDPTTNSGSYTMLLDCSAGRGFGFGIVNVSSNGAITVTGMDPNGASFSQSTTLTVSNLFPFYGGLDPLKNVEQSAVTAWLQVTNNFTNAYSVGPIVTTPTPNYLSWITNNSTGNWLVLISSPFAPPTASDERVITNQVATLKYNVGHETMAEETLVFAANGSVGSDGASTITISKTGLITGTVVGSSGATYKINGVVLQNGTVNATGATLAGYIQTVTEGGIVGGGSALNSTNGGSFVIVPIPSADQSLLNGN